MVMDSYISVVAAVVVEEEVVPALPQ